MDQAPWAEIDLNVRVNGGQTYVGLWDIHHGPVNVGDRIAVVEPESNLHGEAQVASIDYGREMAFLAVDWGSLCDAGRWTQDEIEEIKARAAEMYEQLLPYMD